MKKLKLAENRVEGGFFLHNGQQPQPLVWPEDKGQRVRFLGTYRGSGSPVRDSLVSMIRGATKRVFVASFMLGDEEIIREMLAAAERLRGGVYLITALDEKSLRRGLEEYEESEHTAPEERRKNFERLTSGGVYVRGHEECHAKFAVVDDTVAIVGSANFVTNGLEWTNEADVLIRDPDQVRQVAGLFIELWYGGCTWEIPPGMKYIVSERAVAESPVRPATSQTPPTRFVWTNGRGQTMLLDAIREVADSAKQELTLATYSVAGMRKEPSLIFDHLHRAVKRGVRVRLLVRQRNAWPDQMSDLLVAADMGVAIHGDLRNHAKVIIADRDVGVVFSANLDAAHGLTSGVEAGIRVDDSDAIKALSEYVEHVISNADAAFFRNPTVGELDGQLAARWCGKWPYSQRLVVHADRAARTAFTKEASSGPCLFEQQGDNKICLYAGSTAIVLAGPTDESSMHCESLTQCTPATERLRDWLVSVRRDQGNVSAKRGFCPAEISMPAS